MPLDPGSAELDSVTTPALVIDGSGMQSNIRRMAERARRAGASLRPHAKTHKSPDIARLQCEAGAVGIACATLLEAEDLTDAGLDNILITSPVVGGGKLSRLVRLHRRAPLVAVVDHARPLDELLRQLGPNDPPMRLLVDIDVGQRRTGVTSIVEGVELAKRIAAEPRLQFAGVQGYAGHVQHIVDPEQRRKAADHSASIIRSVVDRLHPEGLTPAIISGSGTGSCAFDLDAGPYTEVQVGSYVFMDSDYGLVREPGGERLPYENTLFVLATVVSANHASQVTVDAGTKALAVNGPPPDRILGLPDGATYKFGGDEHGIITLPKGVRQPSIGSRILICATHCDPTVNLHANYHVMAEDGRLEVWPIVGRYNSVTSASC